MKHLSTAITAILALALIASKATAFEEEDDFEEDDHRYGKYGNENDNIVARIMGQLNRFERKLERFESRFNDTLEDIKKTTTPPTTTQFYGRYAGRYGQQPWTPWVPPTTTPSPKDVCVQAGNFLCYKADPLCIDRSKVCDGTKDCTDGSDERFCKNDAPEFLKALDKCPAGFVGSETYGKCYDFVKDKSLNWLSAMVACVKNNGRLAAIRSRLEQEAIIRHLNVTETLTNATFWIGGTNILRNSTNSYWLTHSNPDINKLWSWVPARVGQVAEAMQDAGFSFWKAQQPDSALGSEFCLEMRGDFNWKWNDQQCSKEKSYICEVPLPKSSDKM